jgi:hypothetical protein
MPNESIKDSKTELVSQEKDIHSVTVLKDALNPEGEGKKEELNAEESKAEESKAE